ncbi:cadherin-like protein 26 isoform X2 [Callorhinchus milii]|uniref:cadherin-like protein 26 isoform X2 n=1 Tax=Callorhinchus milii TaxID=7868 RepID=UPI001C3F8AC0|nr:cadherin-like protein 26 isoform X2 [Callorhinchus milii]
MQTHILVLLLTGVTVLNSSKQNGNNLGRISEGRFQQKSSKLIRTARSDLKRKRIKPTMLSRQKRDWVLATFSVTEEDEGPFPKFIAKLYNDNSINNELKYRIMGSGIDQDPEQGLFVVNQTTGDLFVTRKVDREKHPQFKMTVFALRSHDSFNLDRLQSYYISVKDINDNPPEFPKIVENITIPEVLGKGQIAYRIQAVDKDEKNNRNSKVSYTLISQTQISSPKMFAMIQDSGEITLQGCLDYQKLKFYSLVIRARDDGYPKPLSSTTTIHFNIKDGNNHPPVFDSQSASGSAHESDVNSVILRVKVTDEDLPNTPAWRAKYTITEGNEHGNFKIETDAETNDGIVTLIKQMDYEGGPQRKLKIVVENEEPLFICGDDNDKNSKIESESKTAIIEVVDENDAPIFNVTNILIKRIEGLQPGEKLGTISAYDPDAFYKNKIRYVKAFDPEKLVSVNEVTGEVETVKEMDRESPFVNGTSYNIIIHAIDDADPPLTGTATIHLDIKDENDNTPYLVSPEQYVCIDSNSPYIDIKAADDDMDPFSGPFTFELVDNKEPGIEKWKLGEVKDDSVQLLREGELALGYYDVLFIIKDRQGVSKESTFKLRVCHCNPENKCKSLSDTRSIGAGILIAMLFVALLLFLLISCLLLLCQFNVKSNSNAIDYDAPFGTLIKYNEEGGGASSEASTIHNRPTNIQMLNTGLQPSGTYRLKTENILPQKASVQRMARSHTLSGYALRTQDSLRHLGTLRFNGSKKHSSLDRRIPTCGSDLDQHLNQRIYFHNDLDAVREDYGPRTYIYEGRDDSLISLDSLTHTEQSGNYTYLSQLGSKFNNLANACQLNDQW